MPSSPGPLIATWRKYWPLAWITLVALGLRVFDLDRRPMHADEANQAVKLGELLESGNYRFDPRDHHGPTLYYAALPLAWVRGETTLASLRETTVRLLPAVAGTISVVLLALLAAPLGRWSALAAAALLAVSPPAVYFSRYFIQETLLVTCVLATMLCARRWWYEGGLAWAVGTGVCLGLAQATKATAPLILACAGLAALALRPTRPAARAIGRELGVATLASVAVAALFYSSFGRHPAGMLDAVATYGQMWARVGGGESGHEKPWWYYLQLFTWQRHGGVTSQQLGFSALALAGAVVAATMPGRFPRSAAMYSIAVTALFSGLAYKTPWHAVHLVPGFAVLAAGALRALPWRWLAVATAIAVIGLQAVQAWRAAFVRPADARNPYAYVHSGPDVLKIRARTEAALAQHPGGLVRVIGEEYWPIPWYLRGIANVGYWAEPPADCNGALVIASAEHAELVRARLRGAYTESILGLRPGVLLVLFVAEP